MNIKWAIAKVMKKVLRPPALKNCIIDKTSKVASQSELYSCEVGRYSYLGSDCFLVNVQIGQFCSIADKVSIGGAMHTINNVSTSPVFHEGGNILRKNFATHPAIKTPKTVIGNDVWIGRGAIIKAGVHIGDGAVIGMGSVVTKDVGAYEIWAGAPAVFIRKRFEDELINELLKTEWWNENDDELKKWGQLFTNPQLFVQEYTDRENKSNDSVER